MGILLIFVAVLLLIMVVVYGCMGSEYRNQSIRDRLLGAKVYFTIWAAISVLFYGVVAATALANSYGSYLDTRAYYDNLIAQYKGAIVLYEDKAVSLDMEKAANHALTDMRFQGYQYKMGEFILDLRKSITEYNSTIIKKRLMKKNFFYGWYIIPPDKDMHTIDIISK
jgi:hypothetical protein